VFKNQIILKLIELHRTTDAKEILLINNKVSLTTNMKEHIELIFSNL